jgi:hypothetical protein
MNQTVQREQIRQLVARLFSADAVADELTDRIEQTAPALFYLIKRKVADPNLDRRTMTDKFLRTLPEDLFDHTLVLALGFFRRGARGVENLADLFPELGSLAFVLWTGEQGLDAFAGTDDEMYALIDRFARLVLLEEQRRVGAFAWINPYSLLRPPSDEWPARLPVIDRKTSH